ncbi:unnamed protein product [Rhodiola kirilowii]
MLRNHVIRYKSTLGEVIGSTLNLTQTNLRVLRLPLTIEVPIFSFEAVRACSWYKCVSDWTGSNWGCILILTRLR